MKMDRKTILAIVLGLLAIGIVVYQFTGFASSGKNAASAAPPAPVLAKVTPRPGPTAQLDKSSLTQDNYDNLIATVSEKDLAYRSPAFRNPMSPLVPEQKMLQVKADLHLEDKSGAPIDAVAMGYKIQGIIWNKVAPLALINNQVVGVGEKLDDGSRVTEITPDTAKFTKNGKNYFLVFREE